MGDDLMDILKILADKRMEISLLSATEMDSEYKKIMERVISLEKEYESLDLEPEVKEFMDGLLEARDEANMEQISDAYLVGVKDCVLILRTLGILQL